MARGDRICLVIGRTNAARIRQVAFQFHTAGFDLAIRKPQLLGQGSRRGDGPGGIGIQVMVPVAVEVTRHTVPSSLGVRYPVFAEPSVIGLDGAGSVRRFPYRAVGGSSPRRTRGGEGVTRRHRAGQEGRARRLRWGWRIRWADQSKQASKRARGTLEVGAEPCTPASAVVAPRQPSGAARPARRAQARDGSMVARPMPRWVG